MPAPCRNFDNCIGLSVSLLFLLVLLALYLKTIIFFSLPKDTDFAGNFTFLNLFAYLIPFRQRKDNGELHGIADVCVQLFQPLKGRLPKLCTLLATVLENCVHTFYLPLTSLAGFCQKLRQRKARLGARSERLVKKYNTSEKFWNQVIIVLTVKLFKRFLKCIISANKVKNI